jgi:hypothetical protein
MMTGQGGRAVVGTKKGKNGNSTVAENKGPSTKVKHKISPKLKEIRKNFEGATDLTTVTSANKERPVCDINIANGCRRKSETCLKTAGFDEVEKVSNPERGYESESSGEDESEHVGSVCETECDDECWTCVECKEVFEDADSQMLECERCFDRYCVKCLDMNVHVYEYLQKEFPNTLWCCQVCSAAIRATFSDKRHKSSEKKACAPLAALPVPWLCKKHLQKKDPWRQESMESKQN